MGRKGYAHPVSRWTHSKGQRIAAARSMKKIEGQVTILRAKLCGAQLKLTNFSSQYDGACGNVNKLMEELEAPAACEFTAKGNLLAAEVAHDALFRAAFMEGVKRNGMDSAIINLHYTSTNF